VSFPARPKDSKAMGASPQGQQMAWVPGMLVPGRFPCGLAIHPRGLVKAARVTRDAESVPLPWTVGVPINTPAKRDACSQLRG